VSGLASLGVALLAQKVAMDARATPADSPPLLSWVLYVVAIALFALVMPRAPYLAPHPTAPFMSTLRAMRHRRLFLGLLGAAALCGIAALPFFIALNTASFPDPTVIEVGPLVNYGGWLLWVAALLLLGAAWVVWERNARLRHRPSASGGPRTWPGKGEGLPRNVEWAVMGGLLLLALLLRLPNLDSAPPGLWFDEAMNGVVARDLMQPDTTKVTYISQATQMGALYFYFLGWVIQIFGQVDVWPLRLLPALAGSLIAPMLYIVGSRLFGWRVGLAAGVFVAVSVWNITLSRLGMASMPTVALDLGVYACLVQGLRTGRLAYYAGGGVLLGLALQMYYPSQLVPLVLVLVLAHMLITGRAAAFKAVRAGVVVFVAALVLAGMPIITFAAQHPGVYTERAGDVSIFSPEGSDNKPDALGISAKAHALMFTFRGDRNPRHNLPEADPMLEWPVSALFVVGLGACVLRVRRWQYFFPVVWLLVAVSGGVLSAVFEAPQAHRTLENSVVTALIAGIFVGELWGLFLARRNPVAKDAAATRSVMGQGARMGLLAGAAIAAALLVWAMSANYDRYFNRQVPNVAVWSEMQGANRQVADTLLEYGATNRVLVSPIRSNSPAARYLAPNYQAEQWIGPGMLPFTESRDTVIMLDSSEEADLSVIKSVYPGADVQTESYGNSQQPQVYTVLISAGNIASVRGARYAVYASGGGDALSQGTQEGLALDEVANAPAGSTFEISSTLKVPTSGNYTFSWEPSLEDAGGVAVLVDGAPAAEGQPLALGTGLHSLSVRGPAESAQAGARLAWQSEREAHGPVPDTMVFDPRKVVPMGLTAYVRKGEGFEGPVTMSRVDPIVSFYFHEIPLPRPYTTEWVGKLYAPLAGMYQFHTEQISTSRLIVDGQQVLFNGSPNTLMSGQIELTAGLHDIRLQHQDLIDFSHMYLYWTPPTKDGRYIIPAKFLLPDMQEYPSVPPTGAWPTVDEADDTVWDLNAASQQTGAQPPPAENPTPAAQQPTPPAPASQAPAPTSAVAGLPMLPAVVVGGESDATLNRPLAGGADEDGNLYVFTEDGKVHRFSRTGEAQGSWDVLDEAGKPVTEVSAILVREGRVEVLDAGTSSLITYSPEGEEQGRMQLCQCFYPRGLSVASDGNLWIADTGLGRVIKVTPEGKLVSTLGEKGTGPGQFVEPAGVWEASNGTVYVADVGNARVQSFDGSGKLIEQWPVGTSNARDGSRVVATPDGNVLVTEQESQAVVLYDPQGKELARWTYTPDARTLAPSVIAPAGKSDAGLDSYLVLFPFDSTAVAFAPAR
jgi:streptogramin lyase/4-amino-4-deoxy-L-arabinose transferase-like glycosyltransferase